MLNRTTNYAHACAVAVTMIMRAEQEDISLSTSQHPRKYMIRCDMEGVSGVVSEEQTTPSSPEFVYAQDRLMDDLLALVEGLNEAGADRIVIYDEHYFGRNVRSDLLPANTQVISGKPPYRPDWPGGLDSSFAGLILLGFHVKSGTAGGLLPHSYEPCIADIRLNSISVGEIGMEAAVAGDWGVPAVLVVGDLASTEEARSLLPGISAVAVKEAFSTDGAMCYSGARVRNGLIEAAQHLIYSPPAVQPFRLTNPVELAIAFHEGRYLEVLRQHCQQMMVDDRTIRLTAETATSVWAAYWQIKLICQAKLG